MIQPYGMLRASTLPAIVVLAGIGYAATAPRGIVGGDNGEWSTMFATGGIAHPPGYPAYVLWLRLFRWLPAGTPAHGAALATVALAMIAVFALQRACFAWGASAISTALVSALYAFSPLAWKTGCQAEVFAMNAAFAAAILALSAPASGVRAGKRVILLGAVAGLAVANHQSIVLLAPIGLVAAWRAARESNRPGLAAAAGVVALAAGLALPYVYVYALAKTADPLTTPMWIEEPSLRGVFFHFRRGAYGTLALTGSGAARQPLAHLAALASRVTLHTLGLPIVVVVALAFRKLPRSLVPLGLSVLLAAALVASFDLPTEGLGAAVGERFYLLPELLLCFAGALAIDGLVPRIEARAGGAPSSVALAAIAAVQIARSVPQVLEFVRPTVALYVENTLRSAPPDAIVVVGGDHRWGGFLYARYALHQRPDVAFVVPQLLPQSWYRQLARAQTGVNFETPRGGPVGPKTTIARLLATGRPVLYTDWPDRKVADTPHATIGTAMRVLAPGEPIPPPEEIFAANDEAFARFAMEDDPPRDPASWAYDLQGDYARPWVELSLRFADAGKREAEQECLARVARYAPWLVTARRRP